MLHFLHTLATKNDLKKRRINIKSLHTAPLNIWIYCMSYVCLAWGGCNLSFHFETLCCKRTTYEPRICLLFSQLIVLFTKKSEIRADIFQYFLMLISEIYSNCLFDATNSPKPINIQFAVIHDKQKKQILSFITPLHVTWTSCGFYLAHCESSLNTPFNTVNFCTFPGLYFAHSCITLHSSFI